MRFRFRLNGATRELEAAPDAVLLDVLRDAGCKGVKYGCHEGVCGACTVLLDGRAIYACMTFVGQVAGREVTTIEGLTPPDRLLPLQQKFLEHAALQCGVCTPGFIVSAQALLEQNPQPTEGEVRRWLAGNLCRCTGYDKIVRAVLDTAQSLAGDSAKEVGR